MEFASKLRWAVVVVIVILTLVLCGWGLYSIANNLFRGSGSSTEEQFSPEEIVGYEITEADNVRFTVDGPVIANEEHRSYSIDVNRNVVTMRVYSQYGQIVTDQRSYQNTEEAYETFLKALEYQGADFRKKGTTVDDDYNEQGICARGTRYIIEFDDDVRRWATSCSVEQGTSAISLRSAIFTLFQKQVPDYRELRNGLRF